MTEPDDVDLLNALGVWPRHASEVCLMFFRGMAARMGISFEKYGAVRDAYPHRLDAIGCALLRLARYLGPEHFRNACAAAQVAAEAAERDPHRRDHGNTEYLIDTANFLMIEFMLPAYPGAHFTPQDSAASPGRVDLQGRSVGQESNTSAHENIRRGGVKGSTTGGFYRREGD